MDIRPVDLPALRDESVVSVARIAPGQYERAIRDGRQGMAPAGSPTQAAAHLAGAEVRRLREAELFYVTEQMTDLAVAAASKLPDFCLMPEDLPAPTGFIYFAKPIAKVDYNSYYSNESVSPIVAASWSHWTGDNPYWVRGGVWVTWYTDIPAMLENAISRGVVSRDDARILAYGTARLAIDNESQSPFTLKPIPALIDGELFDGLGPEDSLGHWLAVLKTAWLLMTQPVASVSDATFDRPSRRRLERQGKVPPRVRVITLRRPVVPSSPGESDREYHHQWIVRGHWRQQWYPARQVNRPIWIAPHVKGPEGVPLLGGERVYEWKR
jgi:hypothetical protein